MVTAATPLRIAFFGTPEFAVPTLQALCASPHRIVCAVTQPDRARGRGQQPAPSAVKQAALQLGIEVVQPERLRDEGFLQTLSVLEPDLGVVAAYGKILTDAVLAIPKFGLINVHASLLPKYRGAAPIHRAVIAGETATGVTIMRVVKALDAGPMMLNVTRPIDPDETSMDVERDLARMGAAALVEVASAVADGHATEIPQDESQATYAPKLEKGDGLFDWESTAVAIHNRIRGLHPWPHAFADLEAERTILLKSRIVSNGRQPPAGTAAPGTILQVRGDALEVQTGDGVLQLLLLQREGRRAVSGREFMAGRRLAPGARFVRSQV